MGDILFLAHRVPYPPDRGDKIRSCHILKYLGSRAPVHLLAFADDARDLGHDAELARHTVSATVIPRSKSMLVAGLQSLVRGTPASIAAFDHRSMRKAVGEVLAGHAIDAIYVFSGQMAQYIPRDFAGRLVMDFVDMDSAKFAAYAKDAHGPMAWINAREGRLIADHERAVAARADVSLFVSEAEAALFRAQGGAARVQVVENGIDTEFYDGDAGFERLNAAGPLIVFTGQMDYRPNVEAVDWFAREILPQVRASYPQARFAIVGRRPGGTVTALGKLSGVIVTGEVEDVRSWLAAATIAVAPLELARGIQNKVLEAMAMARPVVATPAAACGIDHGGALRVAEDANAFASEVVALLDDPSAARALGAAARARMVERYGWSARFSVLDTLVGLATPGRAGDRSAA
ncbi:TIGR03087 family PEP-CTERM/XrtA system glycosyltransferase [Stakelama sp. CBK3Z-3]|uniref:TIGR03087 family PEP-CTERM/XrtA system glycosyltransferase n=1 Tax=Stakelama flava TaxID=2860338 RepID=A0ABS6XH30_9SPHN|nr:TIGR03087 family PEP-CTERM/XrtA system glycosyltransferase [Stakelama flava]MBW4329523.1 TIGR03087 family PEP-CTERM/XrtA system glycosyltransferase [Stakelama flava]